MRSNNEPEKTSNIISYLLLMQDHSDRDMIRLAFCLDSVMRSMINCVTRREIEDLRRTFFKNPVVFTAKAMIPLYNVRNRNGFFRDATSNQILSASSIFSGAFLDAKHRKILPDE
ncbi:unnamed protein product [Thlaspi arvense]|uniref:AtC3H46-like PABC-like domain-containing protein n=1 Tax=Thlaspi arvense TaxID=13288 RepID=A0AAU9TBX3_THLAR|nr:unnamed protein product [Thlaspi arvense]